MSRRQINPYDVFAQAEGFAASAKILVKEFYATKNIALGPPGIVNRALAVELYLKCLLLLDGRQPWGHELTQLFNQLLPNTQSTIKFIYSYILPDFQSEIDGIQRRLKELDQPPLLTDFDSALLTANKSFVENRYLFEKSSSAGSNVTIHVIELATRAHIVGRHSDWDTGHPAIMSLFVTGVPAEAIANVAASEHEPDREDSLFVLNAPCRNTTCTQQVALVFYMKDGLTFPQQDPQEPPLTLYPASGVVECPRCHCNNDQSPARRFIEKFAGRPIYLP